MTFAEHAAKHDWKYAEELLPPFEGAPEMLVRYIYRYANIEGVAHMWHLDVPGGMDGKPLLWPLLLDMAEQGFAAYMQGATSDA